MNVKADDSDLHVTTFKKLHDKNFHDCLGGEIKVEEITSSPFLHKLSALIEEKENLLKLQNLTAQVWLLH